MSVHLTVGPMFAGKSTALADYERRSHLAGFRTKVLKPFQDSRPYSRHDHGPFPAFGYLQADTPPDELSDFLRGFYVVLVDEAQFLSESIVDALVALQRTRPMELRFYGLEYDSRQVLWPAIRKLHTLPDLRMERLRAKCSSCGDSASRTQRLGPGGGPRVQVGGASAYEARCIFCWYPN